MINSIMRWFEEKLIVLWEFCLGILERDRLARTVKPKREAEPLIVIPIPAGRSKFVLTAIVLGMLVLVGRVSADLQQRLSAESGGNPLRPYDFH